MQDPGYGLPRIPLLETDWKIARELQERGLWVAHNLYTRALFAFNLAARRLPL
jgi:hypothetical protein